MEAKLTDNQIVILSAIRSGNPYIFVGNERVAALRLETKNIIKRTDKMGNQFKLTQKGHKRFKAEWF